MFMTLSKIIFKVTQLVFNYLSDFLKYYLILILSTTPCLLTTTSEKFIRKIDAFLFLKITSSSH